MKKCYMGIDAGTTGCKVALYDGQGHLIAFAKERYEPVYLRSGWIELDAELVWKKIRKASRKVLNQIRGHRLVSISVSSQGEAVIPVDEKLNPLSRAIVTFDNRTSSYVNYWENRLGRKNIYNITGVPLHGIYSVNKILWFRDNKPDLFKQADRFLCFDAFILGRLGGTPSTDPSMAAKTMMMDLRKRQWSRDILEAADLDRHLLPDIREPGSVVGHTQDNVMLIQGGHDQVAGALGCGVVKEGQAGYSIGTTTCLVPCYHKIKLSDFLLHSNLLTYPYLLDGMYSTNAFNFSGGILLDWCRREIFSNNSYKYLFAHLPDMPSELFVLPYFTISGTPYLETIPMGSILNLSLSSTKWDILKAVLEAIIYEVRLNIELLDKSHKPIKELRVTGGATKSKEWMQLAADILGREILSVDLTDDTACKGVAMVSYSALEKRDIRLLAEELDPY